jgi:hypothetical protein
MPLPKPKGNRLHTAEKLPPPEASGDFDPFLNSSHIGKGKLGDTATLQFLGKCRLDEDNEFGPRLQCDVKLRGETYVYGVKLDGGSYGRLYRRFGNNPKKWKGKVEVEVKKHMGKLYVAVV